MSDGDYLLRAIIDEPDVDLHRLAYADWLMEQGQDDRAEFIRTQIEETSWPGPFHCYNCGWAWPVCACNRPMSVTLANRRADTLLLKNRGWELPLSCKWRRGFVDAITCTFSDWLFYGRSICLMHPVERVDVTDAEPLFWSGGLRTVYTWVGGTRTGVSHRHCVPDGIFICLDWSGALPSDHSHGYSGWDTHEAARAALSAACIRWARSTL